MCLGLACLAWLSACREDVGIVEVDDIGFVAVDVSDASSVDSPSSDATSTGCSVTSLSVCEAGRTCCDTPTERCVPGASGTNACEASGSVAAGEECGQRGVDDCGFGLLCASATSGRDRLVCRRICRDRVLDCGGRACELELEVAGESISLCE